MEKKKIPITYNEVSIWAPIIYSKYKSYLKECDKYMKDFIFFNGKEKYVDDFFSYKYDQNRFNEWNFRILCIYYCGMRKYDKKCFVNEDIFVPEIQFHFDRFTTHCDAAFGASYIGVMLTMFDIESSLIPKKYMEIIDGEKQRNIAIKTLENLPQFNDVKSYDSYDELHTYIQGRAKIYVEKVSEKGCYGYPDLNTITMIMIYNNFGININNSIYHAKDPKSMKHPDNVKLHQEFIFGKIKSNNFNMNELMAVGVNGDINMQHLLEDLCFIPEGMISNGRNPFDNGDNDVYEGD